ncbi:hypothetical protein BD309DRAFT_986847 [Dichomitus squalens]|uniref:Uncharacterized protein n=1 Tax=Dichomitus squalens TaxID=114155 RepID=A0A4Q9QAN6_9APHY|nr:hypothetical protein BD309DRAFT_986847 [Dichomitus squalens]TBU64131.1 hypothetical protein BD310DRAFT_944635 [Dichomitus squalens]
MSSEASYTYTLAILYYDYVLTLPREIEHFWKRAKFSLAASLFVLNRYLGLFGTVLVVIEYFLHLAPHLQTYHAYYTVISQVVIGMLLMIRTYALYNRSRRLVIGFVILGVVLFSVVLPMLSRGKTHQIATGTAVGWIAMICVDTTIFILTMLKAIRMAPFLHHRVFAVLFRDGSWRW